jgi:hypothetical protein
LYKALENWLLGFALYLLIGVGPLSANDQAGADSDKIAEHTHALIFGAPDANRAAITYFADRGNHDIAASLITALRFRPLFADDYNAALQKLTGQTATTWFGWMEWQQDHPEVKPHSSYLGFKLNVFEQVDARYRVFFRNGWDQPGDMRIRLEEIVWGGPRAMTGIPSLDNPKMISPAQADYILDDDLVFGVDINGDQRAYPLRIMGWHEMFNDVIGGVPVALAYCTLCGSGILYETKLERWDKPIVFGSSGMLYRSNKLMFDWRTYSLWNQFTGEPVVGPLAKSGIRLKTRPVVIMQWKDWLKLHPQTTVLSLETGYTRDYASGAVYREYFSSPNLMFPVSMKPSATFDKKDYVYGIRQVGAAKAWPISAFRDRKVINDRIGERNIVLIGDADTRTVRAFERGDEEFLSSMSPNLKSNSGGVWTISENHLTGPDGKVFPRVAGVLSYWFAWDGYMRLKSEYYKTK